MNESVLVLCNIVLYCPCVFDLMYCMSKLDCNAIFISKDTASLQFTESQYAVPEGDSVQVCVQLVLTGSTFLGCDFEATLNGVNGTYAGKYVKMITLKARNCIATISTFCASLL